ncbi:porin [Neolewinella sp.]|uniref:porin n=1 Tax=Neolewinella sp. TaxID=2993543 RepID=UPI003B51AE5D
MRTFTLPLFTFLLLLTKLSLFAQTTEVIILEEVEEEEEETRSFQLSGYVDAYFQNVFTDLDNDFPDTPLRFPTSFTGVNGGAETRGFGVGNVNLLAEKTLGQVGFVGQIGFGPRANEANGAFPNLQQLYVTYSPSESVTFTFGQFGTFVGYEVIDATANMNYSMSYLFSYGPFFHTGLKADFAIAEGFGAMVGIFDNTDSRFNNAGYYYGAQLSAEVGGLAAYLNFLTGTDQKDVLGDDNATTFQVDLTATYEVSETLMFGINASNKQTQRLNGNGEVGDGDGFTGVALYSTIGLSDAFALSLRGEGFKVADDPNTDTDGRNVLALTATGNFTIGDLRIMPELRFDGGGSSYDTRYSGNIINFGSENPEDNSVASFILAAVYAF